MARTITTAASRLDVGRQRSHNEDYLGCRQAGDDGEARQFGDLFVLADGMGGHAAGEVASRLAVETILSAYYTHKPTGVDDVSQRLMDAIAQANLVIHEQATINLSLSGMGTTCVCSVFHGDALYIAHVGDSRAYFLRGNDLEQVTQDHSWVQEQVRHGIITSEEARHHPMRNVITRALGSDPEVRVDLSVRRIQPGDVLLMCSDGLTGAVDDAAVKDVLTSGKGPQEAADTLVEMANEAGGPDNISVIVVRVEKVAPLPRGRRGKKSRAASQAGLRRAVTFLLAAPNSLRPHLSS